jgi:hypothetical protein
MSSDSKHSLLKMYGDVIHADTRKQAIEDGLQICVSDLYPSDCRLYRYPVYFTKAIWGIIEESAPNYISDDAIGLMVWDIVWASTKSLFRRFPQPDRCEFSVAIQSCPTSQNQGEDAPLYKLLSIVGPMDIDDPSPVVTIMFCEGE